MSDNKTDPCDELSPEQARVTARSSASELSLSHPSPESVAAFAQMQEDFARAAHVAREFQIPTEMLEEFAKANEIVGALPGIDAGLVEAALQAMDPVVATPSPEMIEGLTRFGALGSAVERAVDEAVHLTPSNNQELWLFIDRFSTDPKGLGLSRDKLGDLDLEEWLVLYQEWRRKHLSDSVLEHKRLAPSKAGRPKKDQTKVIYNMWLNLGKPTLTNEVCLNIAKVVYAEDLNAVQNSSDRKNILDRVRQAILRSEQSTRRN